MPVAPEGEATRIALTFETFRNDALTSQDHGSLIQGAANAYLLARYGSQCTAQTEKRIDGPGFTREQAFGNIALWTLMDLEVENVQGYGLSALCTHQLRYNRYHYDGSE